MNAKMRDQAAGGMLVRRTAAKRTTEVKMPEPKMRSGHLLSFAAIAIVGVGLLASAATAETLVVSLDPLGSGGSAGIELAPSPKYWYPTTTVAGRQVGALYCKTPSGRWRSSDGEWYWQTSAPLITIVGEPQDTKYQLRSSACLDAQALYCWDNGFPADNGCGLGVAPYGSPENELYNYYYRIAYECSYDMATPLGQGYFFMNVAANEARKMGFNDGWIFYDVAYLSGFPGSDPRGIYHLHPADAWGGYYFEPVNYPDYPLAPGPGNDCPDE